jgi:hypothetical protein
VKARLFLLSALVLAPAPAGAQSAPDEAPFAPPGAPSPADEAPSAEETGQTARPTWRDRVVADGALDAHYAYQVGGAGAQTLGAHAFDDVGNSFTLGLARLGLAARSEPVGARLDLAFGHVVDAIEVNQGHVDPAGLRHVLQAYLSFAAAAPVPFVVDVGKLTAGLGAEQLEAGRDWNHSRSLMFGFGLPFSYTGARLTAALTPRLSLRALVVNGWDRVADNNGDKTFGLSAAFAAPTGTTITLDGLAGIETTGAAPPWRLLADAVVAQTLGPAAFMLTGAYAREGDARWYGVAAYARVAVAAHLDLALRGELFGDPDGVRVQANTPVHLRAVTLTAAFPLTARAELRAEARADFADQPFFMVDADLKNRQLELLAAALASF